MSAFEVTDTHIDALVSAALFCKRGALSWYWEWNASGEPRQSRRIDHENAGEVGTMLIATNAVSVAYRYPSTGPAVVRDHSPRWLPGSYHPVAVLKAVQCYAYQACEHPGWHGSEAEAFCLALTAEYIMQLDGYDAAAWALSTPSEITSGQRNRAA